MADRKPILSLDTLVERAVVAIDGSAYDLKNVGEFSILESIQMENKSARLRAMFLDSAEPTDENVASLEAELDWLCRRILVAPDDIQRRLTSNQRFAVVMAFTNLQRGKTAPPAEEPPTAPPIPTQTPSTGESCSPA